MKAFRRFLGVFLSLLLLASLPVAAMAEEYDLADGDVQVVAFLDNDGSNAQQVIQWSPTAIIDHIETSETVIISSATADYSLIIFCAEGATADVTVKDVDSTSYFDIGSYGTTNLTVSGTNSFSADYNNLYGEGTVNYLGSGTINYIGDGSNEGGLVIDGVSVVVDGPTVTGTDPYCGVCLDEASLTVNHGSVTGTATEEGGSGMYFYESTLSAPGGTIFADGEDVTEAALADPTILNDYATSTVMGAPLNPPVIISDGSVGIQLTGAPAGTTFEKTGEPDEAAMAILSEGIDGECIYKGSFAFTDAIENHGSFFFVLVMPQYAGQRVILSTIDDGAQVTYNLRVGLDGSLAVRVDHLGDFAVFLA